MQRMPPLNALRAFELAARLGSLKAAAQDASVTHGAISRHIRLLEDWLGAPLFLRHNRRVVLTELGQAYLAEIAPAFQRIARCCRASSTSAPGIPTSRSSSPPPTKPSIWRARRPTSPFAADRIRSTATSRGCS
jgi:DNA-binding transcriptional LysR family regulator